MSKSNVVFHQMFYQNVLSICSKSEINKNLNKYLDMSHKQFEDFPFQVTRASCINLPLISPDRNLPVSFFANLVRMINQR